MLKFPITLSDIASLERKNILIFTHRAYNKCCCREHLPAYLSLKIRSFLAFWFYTVVFADVFDNMLVTLTYYKGVERIDEVVPKYELLTTHVGRRTFVCNALMLGIPPEIVMKWTGHTDYNAMKPYTAITDEAKKDEFKTASGDIKEVDMMYKQFSSISYSDAGDFETIVIPFSSPGFMFFAMLPKEDVKLDDAINSLSPASINSLSTAKGYLYMPKYEVEYEMAALVEVLQAINPELAFNQDEITFLNTKVNDVNIMQKTFFKVDEEGVEAAAVTDMSNTYFDNL